MKKNIIIFGSGNHSKVVLDVINEKKRFKFVINNKSK